MAGCSRLAALRPRGWGSLPQGRVRAQGACSGSPKVEWNGTYYKTECVDDCAALETSTGGIYSQICHAGETCTVDGYLCEASMYLPPYLYRCRDTGGTDPFLIGSTAPDEINCGDSTCGAGQKCCVSVPGRAVCVPAAATCDCVPINADVDAGSDDAG